MADYSQDVVAKAREFDRESAPLKTRVHALAKQLGMTSKETIEALGHAGIVVKAASSTVNHNQLDAVLNMIIGSAKAQAPAEAETSKAQDSAKEQATKDKPAGAKKKPKSKAKAVSKQDDSKQGASTEKTRRSKKKAQPEPEPRPEPVAESSQPEPAEEAVPAKETAPQSDDTAPKAEDASEPASSSESEQATQEKPKRRRRVRRTAPKTTQPSVETDEPAAKQEAPEPPAEVAADPIVAAPLFIAPHAVVDDEYASFANSDTDSDQDATASVDSASDATGDEEDSQERQPRPRRRRRGRGRRRVEVRKSHSFPTEEDSDDEQEVGSKHSETAEMAPESDSGDETAIEEPQAIRGSTRLEAQRRRRNERREQARKRHVLSEAEFLARRESVERTMVVRERQRHDHAGIVTEVGVLEDDLLVEHFVTSDTQSTQIGNIYLGRVQNVLPSMEAAFIDIGTERNAVIYAGDLNWKLMGIKGRPRKIEQVLKSGDQILVQVTKDPIGHKGARLTTHVSLAGRFLVYVPGGRSAGISRKLPEPERKRLKDILRDVTPEGSGTIIRTAAEGVSKESIEADIQRLEKLWNKIWDESEKAKARKGAKPLALYEEPDMLIKVVRDVFNEDFTRLVVEGDRPWNTVTDYIGDVAPELESRLQRYFPQQYGGQDVFEHFRIDEQLAKALDRKVWLPSGGTLVIDRTEAMTVIDVNTGKFTGSGGNLEETVTRNNLEAAEEIVRQMRLRDMGGMIVVDFIDMVLPENQDLVLRRLKEALGRDRTRHEVSEVTSLGLVQMTRKRLGTGLIETFSTPCSCCGGRGIKIHIDPVEHDNVGGHAVSGNAHKHTGAKHKAHAPEPHPAAVAMHKAKSSQGSGSAADDETVDKHLSAEEASDKRVADAVDALIVASEKDEPRPPQRRERRKRRTNVRGGEQKNNARDEEFRTESSRSERSGTEHGDDLAALAAAAVAEAREKDPEEPSDDRYVAQRQTRRRRRVVKRNQHSEVPTSAESTNAERASVEPVDSPAEAGVSDDERSTARERGESSASDGASKRRGRRAVRRVRRVSPSQSLHAAEKGSSAQKESSGQKESSSQQGRTESAKQTHGARREQDVQQHRTYEEALAEFEASPRRRRPTRGKSRSDHAPRPEDFNSAREEGPVESEGRRVVLQRAEKVEGGRRRRRAIRRTVLAQAQAQAQGPEETDAGGSVSSSAQGKDSAGRRPRRQAPAKVRSDGGKAQKSAEQPATRRRGTRRAVRRTTRRS